MAGEKLLEKEFTKRAELLGGVSLKFISPGYSGVPDRIFIMQGEAWFVELKTTGEKPTPRQLFVHNEFRKRGFKVWVIDSVASLDYFFEQVKNHFGII